MPRGDCENAGMSSHLEEENTRLRAELKALRAQFEELLQIAAKQSQELEPPDLTPAAYKKMLEKQRADVAA